MPKAAIDEDGSPLVSIDQVGGAGQSFGVAPVTHALRPQPLSEHDLGLRVTTNRLHAL